MFQCVAFILLAVSLLEIQPVIDNSGITFRT